MKTQKLAIAGIALIVFSLACQCRNIDLSKAPKPGSYPVRSRYKGKPAKPVLDSKRARLYRTIIRNGAKEGPNFAGHYTVVAWGCGLGSYSLAIVDAITGKVYFPPFDCVGGSSFGLPFTEQVTPGFKIGSRLLMVYGQPENPDDAKKGVYFYKFDNGRFKLVHFAREE